MCPDCSNTTGWQLARGVYKRSDPSFSWAYTVLDNVKNAITGSYHAIRGQHVARYLAKFEYRFNRRYGLKAMIPRFLTVAVRTPPMPYRLLKLAELYA